MIKLSTNTPSKKTPKTSSNSFAKKTTKTGATLTKKNLNQGINPWLGTNITDGGLGDDIYSPSPWGVNEAGSFSHFKNRDDVNITH